MSANKDEQMLIHGKEMVSAVCSSEKAYVFGISGQPLIFFFFFMTLQNCNFISVKGAFLVPSVQNNIAA